MRSRLPVEGGRIAPVLTSKTTTPTGEVSMRVSRPARARRSSRCRLALAMTSAAWEANITSVSWSSRAEPPSRLVAAPRRCVPTTHALVEYRGRHEGGEGHGGAELPQADGLGEFFKVAHPQRTR